VYFNVNLKSLTKIINNLLKSELRRLQNARCNEYKKIYISYYSESRNNKHTKYSQNL